MCCESWCRSCLHLIVFLAGEADVNFLEWLRSTVRVAAQTAEEHEALHSNVQALTAEVEAQFDLTCITVRPLWIQTAW